ncbi:MAG: transcriptional regulator [Afipia sp.]|nr:transcriptional regulator [Afipia sp.]
MSKVPSAEQTARKERMRVAAEEGIVAMAEVRSNDVAVRKNMARLRELRLANEAAEAASARAAAAEAPKKKRAKKAATPA